MFRNSLFANDPFFSNSAEGMRQMERSMDAMMSNLMDPFGFFGGQRQPAIAYNAYDRDYDRRGERHSSRQLAQHAAAHRQRLPVAMFDPAAYGGYAMMPYMHNMLQQQMAWPTNMTVQAQQDPNSSFYSQSTVMSYQNTGDGRPRIYQASTSQGSTNGVQETRKSVRDSAEGIEKISVARKIGDKAQVITKQRNATGDIEEDKELVNLDEEEEDQFASEFRQRTAHGPYAHQRSNPLLLGHRSDSRGQEPLALEAPAAPAHPPTHRSTPPTHATHASGRHDTDRHYDNGAHLDLPRYGSYPVQAYRERD